MTWLYLDFVINCIMLYICKESPEPAATTHEDSQSFEQTISRFELQFSGMIYTLMEKISEMGRDNYNDALVNVIYR